MNRKRKHRKVVHFLWCAVCVCLSVANPRDQLKTHFRPFVLAFMQPFNLISWATHLFRNGAEFKNVFQIYFYAHTHMETWAQLAFEACEKLFSIFKLKFYWSFSDILINISKYHPHFDVVNMDCDWESQMWGFEIEWEWKKNAGTWVEMKRNDAGTVSFPTIMQIPKPRQTILISIINVNCMILLCRLFLRNFCIVSTNTVLILLYWMFVHMVLRVIVLTLTKRVQCAPTIMQSQPWQTETREKRNA